MVDVGTAIGYLDLDTSKFTSGLTRAGSNLKSFFKDTDTASNKFKRLGTAATAAGSTLTKSVTLPLVGIGTAAVGVTTKFEKSMSQVQATMGITKDSMSEVGGEAVNTTEYLGALAKEMGSKTAFSASEAAEALNYLALAGYSTEEMANTLPTVLNLASAGGMDLATASDMVTDAMSALGLQASDAEVMVDKMAKTASTTNTSVSQLGEAMLTVGGTAKSLQGGTTELSTALGILANNGIKGAEGGTALRNILLALNPTTKTAKEAWKELGISAYDADGNLRPLNDTFQDLNSKLSTMTDKERSEILSKMFNKTDLKSINALLANTGDTWENLMVTIEDSTGSAAQMSETQLDNLSGQLTILKSGLEGLGISIGELLLPMVKDIIGVVQSIVDYLNGLSDAQKETIVKVLEVIAVIGPALLIIGKIMTTVSTLIGIINNVKNVISLLSVVLSGISAPLIIIPATIAAVVAAFIYLWNTSDSFRNFFIGLWEGLKETVSNVVNAIVNFFTKTLPKGFKSFKDTVKKTISNVVDFFKNFDYNMGYILGLVLGKIKQWAVNAYNYLKTKIPEIINSVVNFFKQLPGKIWDAFVNVINKTAQFATNMRAKAIEVGKTFVTKMVEFFKQLPGKVYAEVTKIPSKIKSAATSMYNAGKTLFTSMWNGLKSVWSSISDWIGGIKEKISNFLSGVKDGMSEAESKVNGSHAGGLNYVPWDGYVARLHKGEKVVSANEAKRSGNGGNNYTINITSPEAVDEAKANRIFREQVRRLEEGFV